MITKKELQYYSSLLNKKYRKKENKFLVEGTKTVLEGLNSRFKCEVIFTTSQYAEENEEIVSQIQITKQKVVTLKQKEFEKISDTESPQGIAGVFQKPKLNVDPSADGLSSIDDKVVIMLDNISDPGNLGTIIRNCDWFGVKNILISENIVDYTNPKVIRSSMGSVFHINLFEEIDSKKLLILKERGYDILCADTEGENVFTYRSSKKKILILSSESHGPSEEIELVSDKKICILRIGNAESLNVASASAVLLAFLTK